MTAFVRLSNKKHLQHASRHAELHFSDGLCIMAHSPKAFLLTFHLLVRKSHYQHKMNFLKLEAYPLLARIRQLLPVLGQCLMYFIAAVFLLVASNAALTGSLHGLGSVRISVSGEVIPGAAQRGCPLYLRCSMPDLMR